jgi:hypothetical protein
VRALSGAARRFKRVLALFPRMGASRVFPSCSCQGAIEARSAKSVTHLLWGRPKTAEKFPAFSVFLRIKRHFRAKLTAAKTTNSDKKAQKQHLRIQFLLLEFYLIIGAFRLHRLISERDPSYRVVSL